MVCGQLGVCSSGWWGVVGFVWGIYIYIYIYIYCGGCIIEKVENRYNMSRIATVGIDTQ